MAVNARSFKLNTGAEIPCLGLGTWKADPDAIENAVFHALKCGYRHIDTASAYDNEKSVGQAIKRAIDAGLVDRGDLFVTTKLWATFADRVKDGLDTSLHNLGLDYVDLYLVHWPVAMNPKGNHPLFPTRPNGKRDMILDHDHVKTYREMEKLLDTGRLKAIGVANYSVRYLKQLLLHASVVPAVNQIENHPSLPQQDIVDFCQQMGIHVTAYSALGSTGGPLFSAPPIVALAKKKNSTPAKVLLSWHSTRNSSVLVRSNNLSRIEDNLQLINLDEDDCALIKAYSDDLRGKGEFRRYVYPPFGIDLGFPDAAM